MTTMKTPSPVKRGDDSLRSISFPPETARRVLATSFHVDRGAQSEPNKLSCKRLSNDFEDLYSEGYLPQEPIGKPPKYLRRSMVYFSSVFALLALAVGIVNFASCWSLHLEDFIRGASSESSILNDHQRVLFRSPGDNKTPYITQFFDRVPVSPHRPLLVIHMGPHKTASTALQADLTLFQDRLRLDNYEYLGRLCYPFTRDGKFFVNRTPDSKLQTYFRDMFAKCWRGRYVAKNRALCVTDLRDALLETYGKNPGTKLPNLLISDEALLKLFDDFETNSTTMNGNYVMLTEILSRDWDIVITVAYRRFFEWLPSAKYQKDKPNGRRQSTEWPNVDTSKQTFREGGGIPPEPLFSLAGDEVGWASQQETFAEWHSDHFMSERTLSTIRNISTLAFSNTSDTPMRLRIYHLYGKLSIRTHFLCKVLPRAHNACQASRREDLMPHEETRVNARDNGTMGYPLSYFDALAVAAATPTMALIDMTAWKRQKVANLLRKHYITVSNSWQEEWNRKLVPHVASDELSHVDEGTTPDDDETASLTEVDAIDKRPMHKPKNPWDLPLKCPSSIQLEQLLHASLTLEARYLPKLYRKSSDEHRAAFYMAVAESPNDYCWIDTDALLLQDSVWKEHISKVFSAPKSSVSSTTFVGPNNRTVVQHPQ